MAKYPGQPEATLESDHAFLVAVLSDICDVLARDGQVMADDRLIFRDNSSAEVDPDMPTLLELLEGYVAERT